MILILLDYIIYGKILTSLIPFVTCALCNPKDWPDNGATIPAKGPEVAGTLTVI